MPSIQNPPFILTGMHRSGTSLVASLLTRLEIHMGDQLFAADRHNPHGYFEDKAFVRLHQQMLYHCVNRQAAGWHDWGWTEGEEWRTDGIGRFRLPAQRLIQQRAKQNHLWGWKDPRTTLFLDFWDSLTTNARYLLLYRFPWEVADSIQRLGAPVFLQHPEYAYPLWCYYNRRLLDFYHRHADRCLLLNVNALVRQPEQLSALLKAKFGVELQTSKAMFEAIFKPKEFTASSEAEPLINLLEIAHSPVIQLLRTLDVNADLSGHGLWPSVDNLRFTAPTTAPTSTASVSIVIPCFNHGEFLLEAIASVERCAPNECELLIVNDGSTQPHTVDTLEKLKQQGYRVIDQPNRGLASARNRAIAAAQGCYILPLDADNRLRYGYIEQSVHILKTQPAIGVVYSDCQEFGLRTRRRVVPQFNLEAQLRGPSIDACAVFRKQLWVDCGGYDPTLRAWEDWEFWVHAAKLGWQFHHLPEALFDYRVRPNSLGWTIPVSEVKRIMAVFWRKHAALYRQHLPQIQSEQQLITQHARSWQHVQLRRKYSLVWQLRRLAAGIKWLRRVYWPVTP